VEESKSDATQKAQFLVASAPHSGDWLLALPVASCGFKLADEVFESYVAAAARRRGQVAETAATRKCQKYSELSTAYLCLPIAVETLGPMNDLAYEFFEIICRKITEVSGDSREVSFLF